MPGTACFQEMHQILKDATKLGPQGAVESHSSQMLADYLKMATAALVLVLLYMYHGPVCKVLMQKLADVVDWVLLMV